MAAAANAAAVLSRRCRGRSLILCMASRSWQTSAVRRCPGTGATLPVNFFARWRRLRSLSEGRSRRYVRSAIYGEELAMKAKVVQDADVVTYVVVCDPGDEAVTALAQFARAERLEAAQVTAIGAF